MRSFILSLPVILLLAMLVTSCDKSSPRQPQNNQPRKIEFVLYAAKQFPENNMNITFRLVIRNSASRELWDSTLAPMKVKDIPTTANKIVVAKVVPGDDHSKLSAGFIYTIEHVGISWYFDSVGQRETFKRVEFGFR